MKITPVRVLGAAALAAIALTISACAPAVPTATSSATVAPVVTATATASATPTPTATATAALTCDTISSASALSSELGTPMTKGTQPLDDVFLSPLVYNGFPCEWSGSKGAFVDLVVLGTNSGVTVAKDESNCFGADKPTASEWGECLFSTTSNGYWLSGYVSTQSKGVNATAMKAITSTIAGFTSAAASAMPLEAPAQETGVWPVISCKKLGAAGKVSSALRKTLTAQDEDNSPGALPAGYYASIGAAGLNACDWSAKVGNFTTFEFPGAGVLSSVIENARGVTTVPLPGGAPGYIVPVDGQSNPDIWFFDQPNLVIIAGYSGFTQNDMTNAALALATEFTTS